MESIWLGNEDDPVDPGYIVSFHSGGSEHTEETYVYETENGYHYINVESTTESWGSPRWRHRIISYGDLETKEEVIEHAKHHGASQHIRFPGDNTPHPIEDFLNI